MKTVVQSNDEYLNENHPLASVSKDHHFKFTRQLHQINWKHVAKSSMPFLHKGRMAHLRSLAGAYSLNPLMLMSGIIMDNELRINPIDADFNIGLRTLAEKLVRSHMNDHTNTKDSSLFEVIRKAFGNDELKTRQFVDIYTKLHQKYGQDETKVLSIDERTDDLNGTMHWPWPTGQCWELSATHSGAIEGLEKWIPSSIDMAPSLYQEWNYNYDYLGLNGTVVASHAGRIHLFSSCSVEVIANEYSTYYGHLRILDTLKNNMTVRRGQVIGTIETKPDNALCLCNWAKKQYSCSTGNLYKHLSTYRKKFLTVY